MGAGENSGSGAGPSVCYCEGGFAISKLRMKKLLWWQATFVAIVVGVASIGSWTSIAPWSWQQALRACTGQPSAVNRSRPQGFAVNDVESRISGVATRRETDGQRDREGVTIQLAKQALEGGLLACAPLGDRQDGEVAGQDCTNRQRQDGGEGIRHAGGSPGIRDGG